MGKNNKVNKSSFYTTTAIYSEVDGFAIQEKCCSACGQDHGEQQIFEETEEHLVTLPILNPETGKKSTIEENLKGSWYVKCPKTKAKVFLIWG